MANGYTGRQKYYFISIISLRNAAEKGLFEQMDR
jgi:hypothetical protein